LLLRPFGIAAAEAVEGIEGCEPHLGDQAIASDFLEDGA
jgi:hypothetical protein